MNFARVFDRLWPLDGSSNIDVSIPTGTIWGLYRSDGSKGVFLEVGLLGHVIHMLLVSGGGV
jgi:fructose-1,6-bisphosphatase